MSHPTFHHRQIALVIMILGLVIFGRQLSQTAGAQIPPNASPLLTRAAAIQNVPGTMLVTGENFTPGGAVYVGFYDAWGMQLHEPRWVTASAAVYGPDGSQDPALGFIRGGTINAVFGASYVVYGPDGSQDPARGYISASSQSGAIGSLCGDAVMIRALDAETGAWSNVMDSSPAC